MRLTLPAVAALLSVITVTAQVQFPSTEAGRITGHVVTGYAELVADAIVTLLGRANDQGLRRTTRTDSTGSFGFAGLPAGSYRLSATKSGYTSRQLADGDVTTATFEVGPAVDLAADAHADVQIVVRRTGRIAGRVIRPDGSAAPDTAVGVVSRSRPLPLLDTMTTSQYDGRYEIAGLPPGEYVVVAMPGMRRASTSVDSVSFQAGVRAITAENSLPADRRWTWYPGVADAGSASTVTVLEGIGAEGIDVWLTPAQRFNVSGRVFWPVGTLAENIVIDYGDPAGTSNGVWLVSDPGGLFTIAGIAPGSLTLLVRADSSEGTLIGIASTEVTMDSVEDVRIVVDRPGRIAGRIVYEGNVPASGHATSIVAVQKLLKVSALYPVPESTVDSGGRFALPGLVGEYEFALDGLQQGLTIKRVIRNGRPLPTNRIGVGGGEDIRDIEIVVGH